MEQLRQTIARAAGTDATVLIHGESGVGKEPWSPPNALHRATRPTPRPVCRGQLRRLHRSLIDFAAFRPCQRGVYQCRDQSRRLLSAADDGTLFLDEIGDLPFEAQVKLLRAIEGYPFRPVGSTTDIRADVARRRGHELRIWRRR